VSVQNLVFARPGPKKSLPPLFSKNGCGKRRQDVLPAPFFAYFTPAAFLTPPKKEIRDGKLFVDPGHLQEGLVVGHPHHLYIKACRRRPRIDRALKRIADDHAK
jgi:hypothetical protein